MGTKFKINYMRGTGTKKKKLFECDWSRGSGVKLNLAGSVPQVYKCYKV
jgi:hypothetical protein